MSNMAELYIDSNNRNLLTQKAHKIIITDVNITDNFIFDGFKKNFNLWHQKLELTIELVFEKM